MTTKSSDRCIRFLFIE